MKDVVPEDVVPEDFIPRDVSFSLQCIKKLRDGRHFLQLYSSTN